jgi:hypothetical protein
VAIRREPHCEFCGVALPDMMLGFMEHLDASPSCKDAWNAWRENVRGEMGGT